MPPLDYDQKLQRTRVANLRRLMEEHGLSQHDVACRLGISQSAVSQYLHSRRLMGRPFASRVETVFSLQAGCLDQEDMQSHPGGERAAMGPVLTPGILDGLTAIQLAVIEAFANAARAGSMTDEACAELLTRLVMHRAVGTGGAGPAQGQQDLRGMLARLRLHEVLLLSVGGVEEKRLHDDFGPEVATAIGQHLFDLQALDLPAEAKSQLQSALKGGARR